MKLLSLFLFLSILGCKEPVAKQDNPELKPMTKQLNCTDRIFEKDSILGSIRNHASERISLSKTIDNYTDSLQALDFSECPSKFKTAFQEHIVAWQNIKITTDKYPSLRGELHYIFEELEQSKDSIEFKSFLKQIWDTWNLVEASAN